MAKELEDMTFDELIKFGIELDTDAVVKGESLALRIRTLLDLGARWHEYSSKKGKS